MNRVALATAATAVLAVPLAVSQPARADDYAGDIRATFGRWVDAEGKPASVIVRGGKVTAQYTITNTRPYPVLITGVDSQAQAADCREDVARASNKLDPKGLFPLQLAPGQTSPVLTDETFGMKPTSRCASTGLRWFGNVTAEHQTAAPTTAAPPTPSEEVVTVTVPPTDVPSSVPDQTPPPPARRDPTPFIIVGGVVLLTVLAGIITTIVRRRPKGRWDA